MKNIYILLSQTDSLFSKLIKKATKAEYSHVSISLNEDLTEMYSFGRIYPYLLFPGGYVRESVNRGIFKRFPGSKIALLRFGLEREQYDAIVQELRGMYSRRHGLKYNYSGVIMAFFKKERAPKNRFFCSQFVNLIFTKHGVYDKNLMPKPVHPIDFYSVFKSRKIFEGVLSEYGN